ncbi:putative Transcriptional regulator, GntR family [Vibrio nigripulchritudo MADA3029]|uniref:FadR/GntR family transcriptional regulator n=1 Tax=Vibrio nigripulchritudo TaxID=28173 RepID=UPI0003B224A2|nr:FCD domain-containing protein [Vibrio nigripulchritudo]CCN45491.1 putative Transcriptional regulator, GntR family [Vibrio nigripulchritudo MADA3020]CCN55743.1 putative Transcriptional regulator, GntR family [Vibrio nigripulchritudo MADA3021]CCN56968.1 putative Transcriptional regulator, GntR family [Vibrio nigripulchritudo MADA3029]
MSRATTPFTSNNLNQENTAKLRRPYRAAEAIKQWIVEHGLQPGDPLPQEHVLIDMFKMSKGTIRETMRILEVQGLIRTRTGPKGGAFVNAVSEPLASNLLSNYFYFQNLSLSDIYQLRRTLEPELAASLAGKLSETDLDRLENIINKYAEPAKTLEEERDHHVDSLQFHIALAELADNPLLGFVIRFMSRMLTDMTVTRELYNPPNIELWEKGTAYQLKLIEALKAGDAQAAREIMAEHMVMAQERMEDQEVELPKRFLPPVGHA